MVGERKRGIGDITSLAQSIKELGLLNPITILRNGSLVAGCHRLEACKSLGWNEIEATVVDLDLLSAELAEIDENLIRNELHWFDRDKQLARRKEIYEALHPETKQGSKGGWHNNKTEKLETEIISVSSVPTFAEDTAKKIGTTDRTVRSSLQRAKTFTDEQGEVLKRADIKPTDATKLARMEEPLRDAVIKTIANNVASNKTTNVTAAILQIKKAENEAQAQAAPTKPQITLASWETWLPKQEMCDLLITDPPYSTDVEDIEAFANAWLPLALSKVKSTGRAYVCIGAYPRELQAYLNVKACLPVQQVLVWSYKNTMGPSPKYDYKLNWQAILYFRGPDAPDLNCDVLNEQFSVQHAPDSAQEINAPDGRQGNRYHAWQKPIELAEQLVRHSTKPGDTVLDCFAGTGTFMLAAHGLGRVAYGCDRSPEMLEHAKARGCEVVNA
jgi:ParB-like chromosome segregation protein Spo0J